MGSGRAGLFVRADAAEAFQAVRTSYQRIVRINNGSNGSRNWFLERLLKLGSIDVKKEYTCVPPFPSYRFRTAYSWTDSDSTALIRHDARRSWTRNGDKLILQYPVMVPLSLPSPSGENGRYP